jgi:hypothetical protein
LSVAQSFRDDFHVEIGQSDMTNSSEPSLSSTPQITKAASRGWLKLSVVAAASVLAGGLAAAWWHRKTLTQLRQVDERPANSDFAGAESRNDPKDEA